MRTYAAVTLNTTMHLIPVLNEHENSMRGLKCYKCSAELAEMLKDMNCRTLNEGEFNLAWNWTHDFTKVKIDTKLVDRLGKSFIISGITKNINDKLQYWSGETIVTSQFENGSDKTKDIPMFAYEQHAVIPTDFTDKNGVVIVEGSIISVLTIGQFPVFMFNGDLLIAPFGKLERVKDYNRSDIEVIVTEEVYEFKHN